MRRLACSFAYWINKFCSGYERHARPFVRRWSRPAWRAHDLFDIPTVSLPPQTRLSVKQELLPRGTSHGHLQQGQEPLARFFAQPRVCGPACLSGDMQTILR